MARVTLMRAAAIVLIAFGIGIAGGIWETSAIRKYEEVEGKSFGLFQTPKGEHYRRWGNEVPLVVTLLALAVYLALGTIVARRWGVLPLVSLWVAGIVVGVAIAYYSAFLRMNGDGVVL
ncbi:MAG TPA: hypothetical protein VNA69_06245 [Thermoanaerobaculia bacterium]|nr:hypothetical protein [Thermoanaerobaculia bacterium]